MKNIGNDDMKHVKELHTKNRGKGETKIGKRQTKKMRRMDRQKTERRKQKRKMQRR